MTGKIDQQSAKIYQLYTGSQLGQEVLQELMDNVFMEEAIDHQYGHSDGRKSIIRDILKIIKGINKLLQESSYDGSTNHIPE
jgi:hypothetical protein